MKTKYTEKQLDNMEPEVTQRYFIGKYIKPTKIRRVTNGKTKVHLRNKQETAELCFHKSFCDEKKANQFLKGISKDEKYMYAVFFSLHIPGDIHTPKEPFYTIYSLNGMCNEN